MIASLSRAGINEARARSIISEFVILVTIETTRCKLRGDSQGELELKARLLPNNLASVIHNKFLESAFQLLELL